MSKGRFSKEKKKRFWPFLLGMGIYAVVALVAIGFGLNWFYGYIEAFEASRPKHVLEAYMSNLTPELVCDRSEDVIAQVDQNLQSREQCRSYITQALSGGFNYVKLFSKSTESKHTYLLRTGTQVIGEFTMEIVSTDEHGFDYWEVTGDSFDMSYLIGHKQTIVAPDHYTVTANGRTLDSSYIIGEPQKYEALELYYDDYTLPAIVTYEAGPILGELTLVVTDTDDEVFDLAQVEDRNTLAENCSEADIEKLDDFVDLFVERYVTYAGGSNKSADYNLNSLLQLIVPGSEYAQRMRDAWYGQQYTQSYGDKVVDIQNNYFFQLDEDTYVCDVTYLVDTTGKQGVVQTTNNVQIVVVKTGAGLRVLTVYSY